MSKLLNRKANVRFALCVIPFLLLIPPEVCHADACDPSNVGPVPSISSVTPSTLTAGNTYAITLTGTFTGDSTQPGCTYNEDAVLTGSSLQMINTGVYEGSEDPYVKVASKEGYSSGTFGPTQIMLTVKVAADAPTEIDYVQITCDGCDYDPVFPIQIVGVCPAQNITTVSPATWFAGKSYKTTIAGTGFITKDAATTVCKETRPRIQPAWGTVTLSDVDVVSSTQITATITPDAADSTDPATITVGGANASAQILGNVILWNDIPISGSGSSTQNAVVGQPINLTTPDLPAGITATSTTWTVGATNIAGYNVAPDASSASVAPMTRAALTAPSLSTYWVYAQDAVPVTYKYCVSIPGASADGQCSLLVTGIFSVSGPGNSQMTTDAYSSVNVVQLITSPCFPVDLTSYMEYGISSGYQQDDCAAFGPETGTPGVKFTPPQGSSTGNYSFVQLITHDAERYTQGKAGTLSCGHTPGLDDRYPYPTDANTGTASDSPDAALDLFDTRVGRTFAASMYLMWTSQIQNSIPVPIGYQNWHFRASTSNPGYPTSQNWTTPVSQYLGTDGDFVPAASDEPSNGYPTWDGPAKFGCPAPKAAEAQQEEE